VEAEGEKLGVNLEHYTVAQLKSAIPGSMGIKAEIIRRIGCARVTFDNALRRHPTLRAAFDAEKAASIDYLQSMLMRNIEIAEEMQKNGEIAPMGDAKWLLSRIGRSQGFGDAPLVEVSQTTNTNVLSLTDMRALIAERLARVEELESPDVINGYLED